MGEIVRIGKSTDPSVQNVRTTLIEALADIDRGELKAKKVVLLFLEDDDVEGETRSFDLRLRSCGLRCSELLGLFEVAKTRALAWMGFLDG